jgi:DNA mismatch repair protein MutL
MAKSLAVKTGTALTIKEQENLVNGLLPKIPMFLLLSKPTFITMCGGFRQKFAL